MKINSKTKIVSQNIILVPYTEKHVPKYHEWMKSEELQVLTASEPLTLEQEYDMQKLWQEDEDKCTFIILDKKKYEVDNNEIDAMIGDTNIFVKDLALGEIEIMIAEEAARGRKFGWEAVILMLIYGIDFIELKKYEAKISFSNERSINMFTKLGFKEESRSIIFNEITFAKTVTNEWCVSLKDNFKYVIKNYVD
ncbi:N-acetyltransferase 9 [Pieris napi]|uniref:N-acetyltransferase 9 n=1 Tax=Pieris napi TaxID=78633 RepID=UPI001FBBB3ED|nr:N-acetyltransferase 9 [Pieris napi]